jgi:hypothetical protein
MNTRLTIFLVALMFSASMTTTPARALECTHGQADATPALSEAQRLDIKRIQVSAEKKAAPAVLRLAGIVKQIYDNMLADVPDEQLRSRLSGRMRAATWELLAIKGQSIRDIVNVLTPAQKQLVKSQMGKPGAAADLAEVISHTFKLADK